MAAQTRQKSTAYLPRPVLQGVAALFALVVGTWIAFQLHAPVQIASCFFVGVIVVVSFQGNFWVSLIAAVASVCLIDAYFTPPIGSIEPRDPLDWIMLVLLAGIGWSVTSNAQNLKRRSAQLQVMNQRLDRSLSMLQESARVNRVILVGEMTASIAHEVNQPLTGVISNAGTSLRYLTAQPPDLEAVRTYLELVVRDGRRAADIISRVSNLVKRAPPSKTVIDLNQAVVDAVTLSQAQMGTMAIRLKLDLTEELPRVPADRIQVEQVLLNLLLNAAEAMKDQAAFERSIVVASGLADQKHVFLEVRDNGPGISDAVADRLFEPFFTTKYDGTGMGLAISRLIAEAHGGELRAFANAPSGAVFRMILPSTEPESRV
jgi:signal transduction histidine kinase